MENYTEIDIDRLLQEELSKLKIAIDKIEESNEISKKSSIQINDISNKFEQLSQTVNKIIEEHNALNENNLAQPSFEDLKSLNETIDLQIGLINDDKKTFQKKINDLKKNLEELLSFKENIKECFNHDIDQKLNQYISKENLNSKIDVFESQIEKLQREIDDLRLNEIEKLKTSYETNIKEIGSIFKYLNELENKILLKTEKISNSNLLKFQNQITELKSSILKDPEFNAIYATNKKLKDLDKVHYDKLAEAEKDFNIKISDINRKISEFDSFYKKQEKEKKYFRNYNLALSIIIFVMFVLNISIYVTKYRASFNWVIDSITHLLR